MRFDLQSYGPSLISRVRGAELRELVLAGAAQADQVVLDFASIERASYSFVDELVGKLVTMHRRGDLTAEVSVVNAPPVIDFHIEQCLLRRLAPATV